MTSTTFQLLGSVGNGVYGGTPRVARIFDQTPLMKGHSAVLQLAGNLVGTVTLTAFESFAEFTANDNSLGGAVQAPVVSSAVQGVTNTNATSASTSTKATSALVLAATNAGSEYEIKLPRYAQLLVYPKADQAYQVRIWFVQDLGRFTNNGDAASLDDEMILLHALANAKAHYRQPDAETYQGQLNAMLASLRGQSFTGAVYRRDEVPPAEPRPQVV